jgi:Zn-dependent M32 family carboxypeptidase
MDSLSQSDASKAAGFKRPATKTKTSKTTSAPVTTATTTGKTAWGTPRGVEAWELERPLLTELIDQARREQAARIRPKVDGLNALLITCYAALQTLDCTFDDLTFCHRAMQAALGAAEAKAPSKPRNPRR